MHGWVDVVAKWEVKSSVEDEERGGGTAIKEGEKE